MSMRALANSVKEGLSGILRHPLVTIASITTILLMLLLMSAFVIFSADARHIMKNLGQQPPIEVYMKLASTPEERAVVTTYLREDLAHVKSYVEANPEENYNEFRKNLGNSSSVLDEFDYNQFLPYTYRILLVDPSFADEVVMKLEAIPGVNKVMQERQVMTFLVQTTKWVNMITAIAFVVLFLIALFIISNMVRISVYARSAEINIMKYIGATNAYIRLPFIIEGAIVGLISAVCSWGLTWLIYSRIYDALMSSIDPTSFYSILPMSSVSKVVLIVCAATGILIGAFGSGIAVRKYIKV